VAQAPLLNGPQVSVLMVARNTGPFIGAAIASARAQSVADIEIIVVDDGSEDETRAIAESHAAADARVRVLAGPGAGLAAVRNASLDAARGRRALILDSDDLLAPDHVAGLLALAESSGAPMVAANMVSFREGGSEAGAWLFASGQGWQAEREIDLATFLRANCLFGAGPNLGYLKPLFDMDFLRRHALRYASGLRIGEDFDLLLRAMLAGGQLCFTPRASYFYRQHAGSTSARLPLADIETLIAAEAAYALPETGDIAAAARARRASLHAAAGHARAVAALKRRDGAAALAALGGNWHAWQLLGRSCVEAVAKRCGLAAGHRPAPEADAAARHLLQAQDQAARNRAQAVPA